MRLMPIRERASREASATRPLRNGNTTARLPPELPRHALLEPLEHGGRSSALRLGDEQMHMLRHHHIADQFETVAAANLIQSPHKYVSRSRGREKRKPAVTTESDKVQMAEAVDASQALGHERSEKPHAHKPSVGHPQEQNTTALAAAMVSCSRCSPRSEPHAKPRPPAQYSFRKLRQSTSWIPQ